jgi:acyl-coenzyme A synthetase/AMP-(fatty) acid ligase
VIAEQIFAHARRTPERTAIVYDNVPLSYRQFARLIHVSRQYLSGLTLPGEGVAGLVIASVLDAWIHGLALRSLGLTTVIVRSPDEVFRLGLSTLRCVVAMDDGPDLGPGRIQVGARPVRIPRSLHAAAMAGAAPPMPAMPAHPGGHIQLTSGTTGSYKKVLIDTESEAVLIDHRQKVLRISKQTVFALFDLGGWTSVGYQFAISTWNAGGCVVLYEGADKSLAFRHNGITHAFMVPHMLARLLATPGAALRRNDRMLLFVGGAPLPLAQAQQAKARLTQQVHTYLASSEVAAFAVTRFEQPEDLRWHRILGSRKVEIVDENDRPAPVGEVGRVRIGTIANVTGYFENEAASREFFRGGYFYSGDLGVIRADGRLALHGRVTDVVNVLGDKIAAGPIEDALQQQLDVSGVCVFSMPDEDGEEIIHIAIEAPRPLADPDLTAGLRKVLPAAVRLEVRFIETLPRNSMGKVERETVKRLSSDDAPSARGRT